MQSPTLMLAVLAALAACRPETAATGLLDRRALPYVEDEPEGRRLAGLDARLEHSGDGAELTLLLSAEGPEVDPIPGHQGRRGTNRITARELARFARGGGLEVRCTRDDGLRGGDPDCRATRTGRLPERRLLPDGSLELEGESAEEYALELAVRTGPLAPGHWTTELWVAGRPRLRVRHAFDGERGSIEEIDCQPVPVPEELRP